jgi:hypothetical protein
MFRSRHLTIICVQLLSILFVLERPVQAEPSAPTVQPTAQPSTQPSTTESPPIFIGHPPQHRYVILLSLSSASQDPHQLDRIREKIAPTGQIAFITHNRLGHYIHAASFTHRGTAEAVLQKFLKDEPNARVAYFP